MANETLKISVSDTNASASFSSNKDFVKIKNTGSAKCYFNLNAAATTSHFSLDPSESILIGLQNIASVQAISDSGITTTLKIVGWEAYA